MTRHGRCLSVLLSWTRVCRGIRKVGPDLLLEWNFRWSPDPAQSLERAFELAQKAVALDDSLPSSHQLLGSVYVWKKQYEQAIAEAERAIALDPNDANGYASGTDTTLLDGRRKPSGD